MIPTTICYIKNNKNEYLLLHRVKKKNDLNEGKWIGVGGKFEPGETPDQCVVREVYEETGLTLTEFKCKGMIRFVSDTWEDEDMYLYLATGFTGELKECDEGVLKWVPEEEVLNYPTWEGDKYFLKPLLEGRYPIDMLVSYEGDELVAHEDRSETVNTLKAQGISFPHGFSSRTGGISDGCFGTLNLGMNRGDDMLRVIENWNRFLDSSDIGTREFVCGNQIHGNYVHVATKKDLRPAFGPGELIPADGYVTSEKNVPLAIFTADCVPLLLADEKHGVVGAIHCGWRSTVADIEGEAVKKMISLGADPEDIHGALGPAIDRCCFEVGGEVIDAVTALIGDRATAFYETAGEKYMLDLRGVARERLVMLGLKPENIELVGPCTMCNMGMFWSHRGTKGNRGSQASVISIPDNRD